MLRPLAGFSGALICLSYPAIEERGWSWRRVSHPQPPDYRSGALLIELLQVGNRMADLPFGSESWLTRLDSHQDRAD